MEECYLKVGDLKKIVMDLPDDMPVYYERIEDFYFDENGWDVKIVNIDSHPSELIRTFFALEKDGMFILSAHY